MSSPRTISYRQALDQALRAARGTPAPHGVRKQMIRTGWTAEFVTALHHLAGLASTKNTAICYRGVQVGATMEPTVYHRLASLADSWRPARTPPSINLGWLTIAALAQPGPDYDAVAGGTRTRIRCGHSDRLGPDLGALVYAAGVPLEEALDRRQRGTLDRKPLLVLAALRGYPMPAEPAEESQRRFRSWMLQA